MTMTLEQIKNQLSAIEPDDSTYSGIGPSEIPLLEELLQDKEVWLASRAVFALSRIPDNRAMSMLSKAAADPRKEVRVAVAASASNLKPQDSNNILFKLLTDTEAGVRKFAVQSVSKANDTTVHVKLRDIKAQDPVTTIRDVAKDRLRELNLIGP